MDTPIAITNMLKQQMRTNGILDDAILSLYRQIPRERFVPSAYHDFAYADMNIPIAHEQCMLSPLLEAQILSFLAVQSSDRVLEVGTGRGYLTALVAAQAKHVTSVEIFPELTTQASDNLKPFNFDNISCEIGNAGLGWGQGFFDVIILSGSITQYPHELLAQLSLNGRLFAVIGERDPMKACLFNQGSAQPDILFETSLPPLLAMPKENKFHF